MRERLWAQLMTALYRSGRQSEALHAYQRARTMLLEEFGIEPGPTLRGLERAVLAQEPELGTPKSRQELCPPPPRSGNLPEPPNELVGRTADLDAAANLVQRHRIATIVGTGGVGKTRLAVEVGRSLRERFADGVWLVDLAAAGASADVARTIASTLGAECEIRRNANTDLVARLVEFLTGRSALVVLDNCEHVVADVAPVVHELVARCGALHILATSREPLAVAGEALWPLAPLAPSDALQLFVARAADVAPGSCSDDETLATARGICQHLDGLPLAIELAAACMRVFTPADLLARLDDRFRILTAGPRTAAPRQQTLRAVVDWSHDLLGDDERTVFAARRRSSAHSTSTRPNRCAAATMSGGRTWQISSPGSSTSRSWCQWRSMGTAASDSSRHWRNTAPNSCAAPTKSTRRGRGTRVVGRVVRGGGRRRARHIVAPLVRTIHRRSRRRARGDGVESSHRRPGSGARDRRRPRLVLAHGRPRRADLGMARRRARPRRAPSSSTARPRPRMGGRDRRRLRHRTSDGVRRRGRRPGTRTRRRASLGPRRDAARVSARRLLAPTRGRGAVARGIRTAVARGRRLEPGRGRLVARRGVVATGRLSGGGCGVAVLGRPLPGDR